MTPPIRQLPDADVQSVLARAAQIDADLRDLVGPETHSLASIRESALDAGISEAALVAALAEHDAPVPPPAPRSGVVLAEGVSAPVVGPVRALYTALRRLGRLWRGPGARDGADRGTIPVTATLDFPAPPAKVLAAWADAIHNFTTYQFHRAEGGHPLAGGAIVMRSTGQDGGMRALSKAGVEELRLSFAAGTTAAGDPGTILSVTALLPRSTVTALARKEWGTWQFCAGGLVVGFLFGGVRWVTHAAYTGWVIPETMLVTCGVALVVTLLTTWLHAELAPVRIARLMASTVVPTIRTAIEPRIERPAHRWALDPHDRRARVTA